MNLIVLDNFWSIDTFPNTYSNDILMAHTSTRHHYMIEWRDMKEIQIGRWPKIRQFYGITVSGHGISIHSDSSSKPRKYVFVCHAID